MRLVAWLGVALLHWPRDEASEKWDKINRKIVKNWIKISVTLNCRTSIVHDASPTSSRKRKADALEADDADDDNQHKTESSPPGAKSPAVTTDSTTHLPAPCLAAILNFMWYTDVRQCLLTGKMMAVEAARHVETLSITRSSELVVPAARRFANVSEVNILCLLEEKDGAICRRTATQVIPFLSSFPYLRKAFVGGMFVEDPERGNEVWRYHTYDVDECSGPADHEAIFRSLMDHFCGAFRSKSLRDDLMISGVADDSQLSCAVYRYERDDANAEESCKCCNDIVSSFPLKKIVKAFPSEDSFCISRVDALKKLLKRKGSIDVLRSDVGTKAILDCFWYLLPVFMTYLQSDESLEESFAKKLESIGARPDGKIMFSFFGCIDEKDPGCGDLIELIQISEPLRTTIQSIPRRQLLARMPFKPTSVSRYVSIYNRHSFHFLVEKVGFNLSADDYVLVDEQEEKALAKRLWAEA